MPALTSILLATAAAASVAGTTKQMVDANQQRIKAQKDADQQQYDQDQLKNQALAEADAQDAAAANAAQRAIAKDRGGQKSTLSTTSTGAPVSSDGTGLGGLGLLSPAAQGTTALGVAPATTTGGKNVLGA